MTNKEWLDYLAHNVPDELAAWFDAEHVETEEQALDGDTEPESEDSRERLEAEIESYSAFDIMDTITLDMVIGWINRQAAITAEETSNAWEEYRDATQREITELQAQLYELTADCDMLENERDNLEAKCEEWKKHAMAIENAYHEASRWRDEYREKFGKCIDYADAIHALMDEGMA